MDIQVPKNFIENGCTVEETVLIINFDNSDDPDSKEEDASLERNPTLEEENFENDPEEEPNKEKDSEANKVVEKPQLQQHQIDCASDSVSEQSDTKEESYQKMFMTRQNTNDKEEMKESEKDDENHTKYSPSMKSERKQDSPESDSSKSDDEILRDSEDESDLDSDDLEKKLIAIDLACMVADQMRVNLPRHHSNDHMTLDEIEKQILAIELACSLEEARTREENIESDLVRLSKSFAEHMPYISRVSADVQKLISTQTESSDEDPDLPDVDDGRRYVPFHSLEPESGRVNPIPRHYYSEDSEQQNRLEEILKENIGSRKEYQDLHRPKPVSGTDHVMTPLRNIHDHDELRSDSLRTEDIQRPTNQTDDPENSANRPEVDDLGDRAQAIHHLSANEANRPEQQDNQSSN